MGKVIYLTGAPATGKSTLCNQLLNEHSNIEYISYSGELLDYIKNKPHQTGLDHKTLREKSSSVITKDDVDSVDKIIEEKCRHTRLTKNLIIDSHPITKEDYGFRVTGFNVDILREISPDIIICLYADPTIILNRIISDSDGRLIPSLFDVNIHIQSQINLSMTYGIITDSPVYLIDSDQSLSELVSIVANRCKINT